MIGAHKSVYLAGPISGLSYGEATDWRQAVKAQLALHGIEGLNPMRGKEYLADVVKLGCDMDKHATYGALSTNRGIITRDRWDAQRSDVLLVNFIAATSVSIGTVMEIAWADSVRHPIVVAMEPGNVHEHGMIKEATGFRFTTLDDAVQAVIAILR